MDLLITICTLCHAQPLLLLLVGNQSIHVQVCYLLCSTKEKYIVYIFSTLFLHKVFIIQYTIMVNTTCIIIHHHYPKHTTMPLHIRTSPHFHAIRPSTVSLLPLSFLATQPINSYTYAYHNVITCYILSYPLINILVQSAS